MVSEEKFLQVYGNVLVQAWGDPAVKARMKAEPAAVLKEYGLDAQGATINLLPPGAPGPNATAESQCRLWNDGVKSGTIDFYFPEEPPEGVSGMELSESELEAVAGGWSVSCCSCTPCCCC